MEQSNGEHHDAGFALPLYEAPLVEVTQVWVEQGFNASTSDYVDVPPYGG